MKNVKNCVKKFKKDNKLLIPNWQVITEIARKNNWLLLPYSAAEKLIQEHKLEDVVNKHRAFTYEYFGEIIILYRDNLQEYSKLHAVCHEIGHIYLEHTLTMHRDDNSQQEAEADSFADLLLNRHKKALAVASALIIISVFLIAYTEMITETISVITTEVTTTAITEITMKETEETDTVYYVSRTGSKYHNANCYHIDIDNCIALTFEEVKNLKYEPCKTCRPEKIDEN